MHKRAAKSPTNTHDILYAIHLNKIRNASEIKLEKSSFQECYINSYPISKQYCQHIIVHIKM